ncbi:alpha/beta hydrolase [Rhodospirillum rubrum]|uniref:alpha/beta fold hydrolase n=1 Tax=Rhodospirillum rubrum TaxID=1085 RepID=UPI001902EFCD|nr:alpha/beta hydrolase [Rhodospirillum rubrum]MBK1663132.1 alpha/beta hydrolase [Rhodospirillum rubrum]MBK1675743.1 alpha/beta hydrolase [Rhodospirillum rubrum]
MSTDLAERAPSMLTDLDGVTIAYHRTPGKTPGVVFIHGFMSNMDGGKALFVENWCRDHGRAFVRFDQTGHGLSSGAFEEGSIGRWAADTIAVLDALTTGPQVLIGSSMGGWLMLLAALARPDRVAGLIGLAAAPDFTEDLIWDQASPEIRETLLREGRVEETGSGDEGPTVFTKGLIEDGRRHLLLRAPLAIDCPVRLIHGLGDQSVPWETALRLQKALRASDVSVTLVKDGEHRLSRPQDLDRLGRTLEALLAQL